MYVRESDDPIEKMAWAKLVKLKKIKTFHHILPICHFKSKPAKEFTFELCRICHEDLEKEIAQLGNEKLHEMRYVKVLIKFIMNKNKNYEIVHLDNMIVGILQDARVYFNKMHTQ
jgi:hypothetical protein